MKEVPNAIYKYIEYELYSYKCSKQEITNEQEDCIYGIHGFDINSGIKAQYKNTSPTEIGATALVTSKTLIKINRTVKAIDDALSKLDPIYKKFFEMWYGVRNNGMFKFCESFGISERTFYNYKNKIVLAVAEELGLIR